MEWEKFKDDMARYFSNPKLVRGFEGPDPNDILNMSSDSQMLYLGPIDWTWGKDDKDIQNKLEGVITQYDYRCNQVETLIHEAGIEVDPISKTLIPVLYPVRFFAQIAAAAS